MFELTHGHAYLVFKYQFSCFQFRFLILEAKLLTIQIRFYIVNLKTKLYQFIFDFVFSSFSRSETTDYTELILYVNRITKLS